MVDKRIDRPDSPIFPRPVCPCLDDIMTVYTNHAEKLEGSVERQERTAWLPELHNARMVRQHYLHITPA